jgi:hypothetical protein
MTMNGERAAKAARDVLFLLLLLPAPAFAQAPVNERIGPFVVDFRGAFPRVKAVPSIASGIGVITTNLPERAFGLVFGAHVYPLRWKKMTFGVGGEFLTSRGSRTLEPTTQGGAPGPTVNSHFSSYSPHVSFNFGAHDGWSYVSGGIGESSLRIERADAPLLESPRRKTINYGFGARWFASRHFGVSLDARWYAIAPQFASATVPAQPRMTVLVFNGGIAIR